MKKIYSFAIAAVALFSAASCQKELVNAPMTEGGDFTVTAIASADTKTVLVDGVKTYWTPGDKISLFDAEGIATAFGTDITENAATAKFTNEEAFTAPEGDLLAVYPHRIYEGKPVQKIENDLIKEFRIAGTQTAVAGSFDPAFGVAVGKKTEEGVIAFSQIHSLIKFTIGGEKAPKKVSFTNGGWRNIAGRFDYNIKTGEIIPWNDGSTVTLVPAEGESFEIGKTYYIAFIAGGNLAKMSLKFDDEEVKYIEGPKYGDESNNFLNGKIINLGTVAFPVEKPEEEPAEQLEATLVRAFQSQDATSYMTTFGGEANRDRNMTTDGEYIYIAETKGDAVLWKISIAEGLAEKVPTSTVNNGGTFALACPRMIKNTDANINGGKDVLAVCNMGQGTAVYLYLYVNGTSEEPVAISLHYDGLGRRLGDQFSVSGTLQSGYVWFKEQGTNAIMLNQLIITSENLARFTSEGIWPDRVMLPEGGDTARGSLYFYPGADWSQAIYTSTAASAYVTRNADVLTAGKPTYQPTEFVNSYTGCHGFNFFKHNGKDYIAYASYDKQTLYIIEGAADAQGVKAAMDAQKVVFEAKIAAEGNTCIAGNSGADCAVVQKDGKTYVAGHVQNVGVVVYELK